MERLELILFTRSGCCLCEGLEKKLQAIPLEDLNIKVQLSIKDIDGNSVTEKIKQKFSMEVPVLAIKIKDESLMIKLPRVSPRLKEKDLLNWLNKTICEKMEGYKPLKEL